MNKLFLVLLLIAQSAFAVTGNKVWRVPSGGSLGAWGPVNLADGTNAITGVLASKNNLPAVGYQISSSSSTASTSSGSYVDVTNLSVTLTTVGRPVLVFINSAGSGTSCDFSCQGASGGTCGGSYRITRDGTEIAAYSIKNDIPSGANDVFVPGSSVNFLDVGASAASHAYKLQYLLSSGSFIRAFNCVLVTYEL